jgi:hypothetical protein
MRTSTESFEYLQDIVDEMVLQFSIGRAEAIARINQLWHGQDLSAEDDLIFHELPYYWAFRIYYAGSVPDWSPTADRSGWPVWSAPSLDSGFWPNIR